MAASMSLDLSSSSSGRRHRRPRKRRTSRRTRRTIKVLGWGAVGLVGLLLFAAGVIYLVLSMRGEGTGIPQTIERPALPPG